jgi:hypothetical protein
VVYEDANGHIQQVVGSPAELRSFADGLSALGGSVLSEATDYTPKDFSIAKFAVNAQMKSMIEKCKLYLGDGYPEAIIGNRDDRSMNFRHQVATLRPYKGNRTSAKPIYYQRIRDLLITEWGGREVREPHETDDEVSIQMIRAARDGVPAVLCTIDKDLDQIPGLHYDYRSHVFYTVSALEAELVFYRQVLSGDATDNIPGALNVGVSKAAEWVTTTHLELTDAGIAPGTAEWHTGMWAMCVTIYQERGTIVPSPKTGEQLALETAQLVRLLKRPGELWQPR